MADTTNLLAVYNILKNHALRANLNRDLNEVATLFLSKRQEWKQKGFIDDRSADLEKSCKQLQKLILSQPVSNQLPPTGSLISMQLQSDTLVSLPICSLKNFCLDVEQIYKKSIVTNLAASTIVEVLKETLNLEICTAYWEGFSFQIESKNLIPLKRALQNICLNELSDEEKIKLLHSYGATNKEICRCLYFESSFVDGILNASSLTPNTNPKESDFSPKIRSSILTKLHADGAKQTEIAKLLNTSKVCVSNRIRSTPEYALLQINKQKELFELKLVQLIKQNKTAAEIVDILDISVTTVYAIAKKFDLNIKRPDPKTLKDLSGSQIGFWLLQKRLGYKDKKGDFHRMRNEKGHNLYYECKCTLCGTVKHVMLRYIVTDKSSSCHSCAIRLREERRHYNLPNGGSNSLSDNALPDHLPSLYPQSGHLHSETPS